ncbi:hypothetical protein [Secundilactobacillus oryzae]|uniref:hypothetical protein n=1 Tax=Secundilactobacillus oryzae TaxID=1202668 RepID=UPI00209374DC|nr:hypothetical protein [Secundilactobacillus oryzae]
MASGKVTLVFTGEHPVALTDVDLGGDFVLYTRPTQPDLDTDHDMTNGVYAYDVTQASEKWVTESVAGGCFYDASFSPDGQKLALIGNDLKVGSHTVDNLWVYEFASDKLTNLTHAEDTVHVGYVGELATDFAQTERKRAFTGSIITVTFSRPYIMAVARCTRGMNPA